MPTRRMESLASMHYSVEIDGIFEGHFKEVSGLEAEIEVLEYQEGGNNLFTRKLPGRAKFSNITLKNGVTESNELWKWFEKGVYGHIERRNISIVIFLQNATEVRRWNLQNAYPIKWTSSPFNSGENAVQVETVVFAHEGLSLG